MSRAKPTLTLYNTHNTSIAAHIASGRQRVTVCEWKQQNQQEEEKQGKKKVMRKIGRKGVETYNNRCSLYFDLHANR